MIGHHSRSGSRVVDLPGRLKKQPVRRGKNLSALYKLFTRSLWLFACDVDLTTKNGRALVLPV
jgi:hypothetical protein